MKKVFKNRKTFLKIKKTFLKYKNVLISNQNKKKFQKKIPNYPFNPFNPKLSNKQPKIRNYNLTNPNPLKKTKVYTYMIPRGEEMRPGERERDAAGREGERCGRERGREVRPGERERGRPDTAERGREGDRRERDERIER